MSWGGTPALTMAVFICAHCHQRIVISGEAWNVDSRPSCPTSFCRVYRAPHHYPSDAEADPDANGGLSNAIRALEEQER